MAPLRNQSMFLPWAKSVFVDNRITRNLFFSCPVRSLWSSDVGDESPEIMIWLWLWSFSESSSDADASVAQRDALWNVSGAIHAPDTVTWAVWYYSIFDWLESANIVLWRGDIVCCIDRTAGIQFAARSPVGWSEVKSSVGTPHPEPLTK